MTITTSSPTSVSPPPVKHQKTAVPSNGHSNFKKEGKDTKTKAEPKNVNGHKKEEPSHPGSDYWFARNPVADQVFITDVTVNLKTVTIRECKTEKGFFKDRPDTPNNQTPKSNDVA